VSSSSSSITNGASCLVGTSRQSRSPPIDEESAQLKLSESSSKRSRELKDSGGELIGRAVDELEDGG
jgi:hypothetical protein